MWLTRILLILVAAVPACREAEPEPASGGYAGAELPRPEPKPEFVLTTTEGKPFDFRKETDGHLTFLFFGYTNCPDICPVHMANLAAALDRLPGRITRNVRVVFVTTDPARDTPEKLRKWLDSFDRRFIGLTGTENQVTNAQIAAGVLPAVVDRSGESNYTVGHWAQVLSYTPDNLGRVRYAFGTRQSDWVEDIPRLVRVGKARS